MKPTLDIVIVNWNAGEQLRQCLASMSRVRCRDFTLNRVIVVDNGSTDGSAEGLEASGVPLLLLLQGRNAGFSRACNAGAAASDADYLLFLNPDTMLYEDSLEEAVAFMERPANAKVGIAGIALEDESGHVSVTCGRFPQLRHFLYQSTGLNRLLPGLFRHYLMNEWDHRADREVGFVIGAFFLIRRELFVQHGGFDERFFVYFEEIDLAYRIYQSGYSCRYLAGSKAYHKGGGVSENVKAARLFYFLRCRLQYAYKHFGPVAALLHRWSTMGLEPAARQLLGWLKREPAERQETREGYRLLREWLRAERPQAAQPRQEAVK
ncbi:glycosyltransferase family 2 protein [Paenibacillus athensensis]|uniref:Glycosyltransferase 2-like domain-containing protein n=1 Tax=Paenibacillus athensensis TaxID=1967502 RepID=A0A4Y8PVF6_9BACL|nr:glycosyltransferase family 2 protein [Paenibacillus athensensis]MCD1258758.1 glycosyltransferase family 2 protein [Paenibacillus athensensis]